METAAILDEVSLGPVAVEDHWPSYKVPRRFRFVDALPRSALGKPLKPNSAAATRTSEQDVRDLPGLACASYSEVLARSPSAMCRETLISSCLDRFTGEPACATRCCRIGQRSASRCAASGSRLAGSSGGSSLRTTGRAIPPDPHEPLPQRKLDVYLVRGDDHGGRERFAVGFAPNIGRDWVIFVAMFDCGSNSGPSTRREEFERMERD